jgi:hypothetical protein
MRSRPLSLSNQGPHQEPRFLLAALMSENGRPGAPSWAYIAQVQLALVFIIKGHAFCRRKRSWCPKNGRPGAPFRAHIARAQAAKTTLFAGR